MPLLQTQPFARSDDYRTLPDHAEVFHCEITGEVFRDYEEYCERIILVNSMVWCCEITGVPCLTYAEASESERKARKLMRGFPMELRVPVLYLASRTKRCAFAKMSDDIYFFVRDRYFVGETVKACVKGDSWAEAHVLSVTASKNSSPSILGIKDPSCYKYEVELFDDENEPSPNNLIILSHDKVRREKGAFTRIKNQLYIKQFMEQGPAGILQLKESVIEKYNINKVKFDQIFVGNPPDFPSSKKFDKIIDDMLKNKSIKRNSIEKKSKQESIAKYMTKSDKFDGTLPFNSPINKTNNKQKNLNDSYVNGAIKNKLIKCSKKEQRVMFAAYMKEWNKTKDDLELEDHKALPKTVPVEIPDIPNKYFGDFMAILEFFLEFSKPIKVRNYFSNGVDIETLRRALTAKEVAGPLCDIIQMLLCALFNLQEEEAEEYNDRKYNYGTNVLEEDGENPGHMTVFRGTQLATVASNWSKTYLATALQKLPMDSQTFSEILRLHLLSSGSNVGENCAKWRYQQRGGYNSQDDPGLLFKMKHPHVLKALSTKHVTQLPLSYKIKLINCLINQILTYSTIRDIIEENQEKSQDIKTKIKTLQSAERKREAEFTLARQKIKKDAATKKETEKLSGEKAKAVDDQASKRIEDLKKDSQAKRLEFEKKYKEYHSHSFAFQSCLGTDRAFRRYWMFETVEGLFVEHTEEFSGRCLDKPVDPNPLLASAPPEDALSYVQKMFKCELNGGNSDKENDSQNVSPRKSLSNQTGSDSSEASSSSKISLMQDLLMCTADSSTCPVHSSSLIKTNWSFFENPDNVDELISSLNKRGVRENNLRQLLEQEKELVTKYITKCPKNLLNPNQFPVVGRLEVQSRLVRKYVDANLRYPPDTDTNTVLEMALRDALLDIEEKIYHGALGELKIQDRTAWRDAISNRSYDQQCTEFTWGLEKVKPEDTNTYRDPANFLTGPDEIDSDVEAESSEDSNNTDATSVHSLACALLQIEQAVVHKHLKRPLGYDEKELIKEGSKVNFKYDALKRWETSLMASNSYAQISLHLLVLENSIEWSRSILNANCRICRKKNDDENMLLCDNCNKGYHMYCLKPKLTKVPKGDWFCNNCKPREKTPPPKKRNRKIFKEEESADESDDDSSTSSNTVLQLCVTCRSGGSLVQCSECVKSWHLECLPQPLQRRSTFVCTQCSKQSNQDKDWDPKIRRCAADAMNNIDHYKKMLKQQHLSDSESADEPLISKARKKKLNGSLPGSNNKTARNMRSRRSMPETYNGSENSDSDESSTPAKSKEITNGNGVRKSTRSSDNTKRNSLPSMGSHVNGTSRKTRRSEAIHQTFLEELINEVMNHKDSWPFNAPVTVEEAPDYFEIITEPMDFGTIKRKLQNGKYSSDAEFVNDVLLVFNNCYRYNRDEDIVAKAGMRLQKFFEKRCKDMNLTDLLLDDTNASQAKRLKISD